MESRNFYHRAMRGISNETRDLLPRVPNPQDDDTILQPDSNTTSSPTQDLPPPPQQDTTATAASAEAKKVPTSTVALAAVIAFLVLAIAIVAGTWIYRRRRSNQVAPSSQFASEEKKTTRFGNQVRPDLTNQLPFARQSQGPQPYAPTPPGTAALETGLPSPWRVMPLPHSGSSANGFHVRNHDEADDKDDEVEVETSTGQPASYTHQELSPKLLSEKRRPSQMMKNLKAKWKQSTATLSVSPEDMITSPPPSYTAADGGRMGQMQMQQDSSRIPPPIITPPINQRVGTPTPPTPPPNRKSHIITGKKSSTSKLRVKEKRVGPTQSSTASSSAAPDLGPAQYLTVPASSEALPVISPARSESFAPKDMLMPPAPIVVKNPFNTPPPSSAASFYSQTSPVPSPLSASSQTSTFAGQKPKLMTVVAPFIPTLQDELSVKVGDTVRVLQVYSDGWCFAQFVGKVDSSKGCLPLVCLKERQRFVPPAAANLGGKGSKQLSNGSLSGMMTGVGMKVPVQLK